MSRPQKWHPPFVPDRFLSEPRKEYAVNGSWDTLDAGRPDATGELWPEGFITRRYSLAAYLLKIARKARQAEWTYIAAPGKRQKLSCV
jgi:hypothetical protein